MKALFLFAALMLFAPSVFALNPDVAGDYYDWSERTDRYGKPAGIFEETPFPITENSTSYSIKNDEFPLGKTYYLGTKYFVDGGTGIDANDCTSFSSPCKTIRYAITKAGAGNKTIIVRGAHDSFNGIYYQTAIALKPGIDDSHRWMITGYGQERPIVDGNNSSYDIIQSTSTENAFVTIQRIKVQNNKRDCISLGVDPSPGRDNFSNIVDVETFNCVNFDFTAQEREGGVLGNANIALYNSNNAWLFHVASNHSMDHCIKIGDNSSNTIVEWSIAYECGWWPTFASEYGITDYRSQLSTPRAVAFDLVADSDNVGYNRILRYNIGRDALYGGIQLRNSVDSSVHHNEIYGTPRFDDLSGINCSQSDPPYCPQVLVIGYGDPMNPLDDINVYSNVIHDAGDAEASGIGTNRVMASHTISIYNNLLYGNKYEIALYGYTNSGITNRKINIFNNTLWHNNSAPAINAPYDWGTGEVTIKNNIIAQLGNGKCVNLDSDIQDYSNNLYYFPNGTRGNAQSVNDYANGASTNPLLSLEPIGSFAFPMGAPAQNSGAINNAIATELFNNSFNGTTRPQGSNWDIGAYEFIEVQSDLICNMHMERYSTEQLNQERLKWISGEITLKEFIIKIKIWKYCPTT